VLLYMSIHVYVCVCVCMKLVERKDLLILSREGKYFTVYTLRFLPALRFLSVFHFLPARFHRFSLLLGQPCIISTNFRI